MTDPGDNQDDPLTSASIAARGWSQVWQMPVLLVGLGLFCMGVYAVLPQRHQDDFPGALDVIAATLAAEDVETAHHLLERLEPQMVRATRADQARFEELFGDLVFAQQRLRGHHQAADDELMLGYYRQAAELGRPTDDLRLQRMAEVLVSLGREEQALELLAKLGEANRRYPVLRKLIERQLASHDYDPVQLEKLVARFLDECALEPDKALERQAEIWGITTRMQLLLNGGSPAAVIDAVQRKKIALMDRGGERDLAPLDIMRGKAYLQIGNFEMAREAFTLAMRFLPQGDPMTADALIGLGQIELSQTDDIRAAWQYFRQAEENFRPQQADPARAPYFRALLGRADCEARMGRHADAHDHFKEAVKVLTNSKHPPTEAREALISTTLSHHAAATDLDLHDMALRYLLLLQPLAGEPAPPWWLSLAAGAHERMAAKLLRDAGLPAATPASPGGGEATPPDAPDAGLPDAGSPEAGSPQPPAPDAIRLLRQDAARHFEAAGEAHARHAAAVSTIDPKAAGDSWWAAAAAFDNAFQWTQAVAMYQKFIDQRQDDPRVIDATHKLGMAYLADKKYEQAIEMFEALRQKHATHKMTSASLVPLARALMAVERLDEATQILLSVVTDHPAITPQSVEYRDALIALGRLYHQRKEYENAIQRLAMAVERYGDSAEGPALRFLLAESYRQSVPAIDQSLAEPLPQSKVREYQAERVRRLEQALILHSQVVTQLGEVEESELTPINLLYYRNASFYRADCAFDLRRFEQAIELYDAAARRWRDHPSSLVALVQMVNAYAELGQHDNARAVNLRARDHLRRIPEEAFNDPSLPMTRKHWQDWLHWSSKLNLFEPQASVPTD